MGRSTRTIRVSQQLVTSVLRPCIIGNASGIGHSTPGGRLFMHDSAGLTVYGSSEGPAVTTYYGWDTSASVLGGAPTEIPPPPPLDATPRPANDLYSVFNDKQGSLKINGASDAGYFCGQATGFYAKIKPDGTKDFALSDQAGIIMGANQPLIFDHEGFTFNPQPVGARLLDEDFVPQAVNGNG